MEDNLQWTIYHPGIVTPLNSSGHRNWEKLLCCRLLKPEKHSTNFQTKNYSGLSVTLFIFFNPVLISIIGLPEHPTINLLYQVIYLWFYEENNLRPFERSELDRKIIFGEWSLRYAKMLLLSSWSLIPLTVKVLLRPKKNSLFSLDFKTMLTKH